MTGTRLNSFLPSTLQVAQQITDTRRIVARSLALLRQHPQPDTFLGRKTQEAFPQEPPSEAQSTET